MELILLGFFVGMDAGVLLWLWCLSIRGLM
jgi:hypothetical protein